MKKINEGVFSLEADLGPSPDFDYFSDRFPDIASANNSLSRGEVIKDIKEGEPFYDEYFKTTFKDKPKRIKLKPSKYKKKEYKDGLTKVMKFKEFLAEDYRNIGGSSGTMGYDQPNGSGMNVNPGGDIISMSNLAPAYVKGEDTIELKDPYFNKDKSPIKSWKKKKKNKDYNYPNVDKIMKLKEF